MSRIQVPGISTQLQRLLELTSPLSLEIESAVVPVIIVGQTSSAASAASAGLSYDPTTPVSALRPELFGRRHQVVANAGQLGYAALINREAATVRVTSLLLSSAAAQDWTIYEAVSPNAQAVTDTLAARDTRLSAAVGGARTYSGVRVEIAAAPDVGWTDMAAVRTLAGTPWRIDSEFVLEPGAVLAVSVGAVAQTYQVTWEVEVYR